MLRFLQILEPMDATIDEPSTIRQRAVCHGRSCRGHYRLLTVSQCLEAGATEEGSAEVATPAQLDRAGVDSDSARQAAAHLSPSFVRERTVGLDGRDQSIGRRGEGA